MIRSYIHRNSCAGVAQNCGQLVSHAKTYCPETAWISVVVERDGREIRRALCMT
jgi:hypothetical protein